MKIGLHANPRKPRALELGQRLVARIGGRADLVVSDEAVSVGPDLPHLPLAEMRPDVVVAIGGDGTFLYTLGRTSAPVLPINAGTFGVLAEVAADRPADLDAAVERLLSGFYHLEERMKLGADLGGQPLPDATNEFLVHAAHAGKMGMFEVAFDDEVVGRIRADGLIVATPTGSTAYSLSSFGPLVDPGLDALILTAIAPFRAVARAIVVEPLHTLRLRNILPGREALAVADGQAEFAMPPDSALTVYRSPRRATFVRFGSTFFDRLRGKRILPWSEDLGEGGTDPADLPPPP
ncbi:MAG TPA: NAD(+)/NADH kinase [Thermoplasmata archaeon]|nr:NAD(+)/NADH kinase [Thermoplasmata archaeon]